MSRALILTGAPGTGKTAVLAAWDTRLEIDGTEFGPIESEQLARGRLAASGIVAGYSA